MYAELYMYIWAKVLSVTVFTITTALSDRSVTDWPPIALCHGSSLGLYKTAYGFMIVTVRLIHLHHNNTMTGLCLGHLASFSILNHAEKPLTETKYFYVILFTKIYFYIFITVSILSPSFFCKNYVLLHGNAVTKEGASLRIPLTGAFKGTSKIWRWTTKKKLIS